MTNVLVAQNVSTIDSLQAQYDTVGSDSLKVDVLKKLYNAFLKVDIDSSLIYSNKIIDYSIRKGYEFGSYEGYLLEARYYWYNSDFNKVIKSMNNALKSAENLNDLSLISNCYVRLAMAHSNLSNFETSRSFTQKAIEIAKKQNDLEALGFAIHRLGNSYYYQNKFHKALEQYLKIDSLVNLLNEKPKYYGGALSNIGNIFMSLEEFDKAYEYFIKGQQHYSSIDDTEGVQYVNVSIARNLLRQEKYNEVLEVLKQPLEFYKKNKNKNELQAIYSLMGESYLRLSKVDEAEQKYLESLQLSQDIENKFAIANSLLGLAEIDKLKGYHNKSLEKLNKAKVIYTEIDIEYFESRIYKLMAENYANLNNAKLASKYYEEYIKLESDNQKARNDEEILFLETKYQTQKKEQEIELLTAQNKLIEEQKSNQRNLLLAGLGLAILAGLFFFYQNRNKQKVTKKLKELDDAKNKFIANITHELRTPLTLISGPVQKLINTKDGLDNIAKTELKSIKGNSDRLLKLVDQLLEVSKIESGASKLSVSKKSLMPYVASLCQSFEALTEESGIDYSYKIEPQDTKVYFDSEKIEKTILNLLSNAVKYSSKKEAKIEVVSHIESGYFNFSVSNTVDDADAIDTNKFFERFYQGDEHREGVGLGLALVKELVELHKGTIQVNKKNTGNIEFSVHIPIEQNAYSAEEIIKENEKLGEISVANVDINNQSEIPILLIIDDNQDIRHFVKTIFETTYQVIQANDGSSGLETAIEHVPDIIISDIMMPGMDGNELTQKLKSDERTSHIPIILLTAKVDEESKVKGAKVGADAYMTKPFNVELLDAKVKQLLDNRRSLQERYSQELVLKPKDIAITSTDQVFLEKVQHVLDDNLTNPDFNTEQFGEAVGMSRMQLYRKLKALTGLTATEFIRSQRLKLATSLLQQNDINIAEIGYAVGFNDPSYFSKCFKEAYGCTPKAYAQNSNNP